MNKNIPLIFAVLFVCALALQTVEPVAAAKIVDKQVKFVTDNQYVTGHGKEVFTVYQYNKNNLWLNWKVYQKVGNKYKLVTQAWTQLKKTNKNTLRIKDQLIEGGWSSKYINTKLTAAQYYWRVYRIQWLS